MATSVPVTKPTSTTPILDLEQPLPRRNSWKRWVGWTAWIVFILVLPVITEAGQQLPVLGGVFQVLDIVAKTFFGTMLSPASASFVWSVALIWLALYGALVIHELGHVIAGLAVRFRPNFVIIFPFRFTRTRTGWAVQRERLTTLSGAASMLPPDSHRLRTRLIIFVLGGPAANFLTFLILRPWLPNLAQAPNTAIFFFESLANMSLFLGAANLLPFQARGFQSDGARFLMAVAKEQRFRRWFALVRLSTAIASGTRARDLDTALIGQALEFEDRSGDSMRANLIAYSWAADRDEIAGAAGYLERCLAYASKLPNRTRSFLMLEAAVFQGWYREDATRAVKWFDFAGKSRRRFPALYRLRPEIAVLWAEGRHTEAQAKLQEAIAAVQKMPANATRDLLELSMSEWQQKMRSRLEARQASAAAES